jgi:hypothetical protein
VLETESVTSDMQSSQVPEGSGDLPATSQAPPSEVPGGTDEQGTLEREPTSEDHRLPFHPVTTLFNLLDGEEYESFKKDIESNGLLVPIWVYQGQIIDGRNRYRACIELGIKPKFQEWDGCGSLVAFALSLNKHRRHDSESQRAMTAAKAKSMFEEEARQRMLAGKASDPPLGPEEGGKGEAAALAAEQLGVGRDSVYKAQKVLREGTPSLQHAVESGQVSVSAAADLASLPKEEQEKAVAGGKKEMVARAKKIHQEKKGHSAGKDSQKKHNPGAQPAKPVGEKCVTLDLGVDDQKLANFLVKHLGRARAKRIRDVISKILNK